MSSKDATTFIEKLSEFTEKNNLAIILTILGALGIVGIALFKTPKDNPDYYDYILLIAVCSIFAAGVVGLIYKKIISKQLETTFLTNFSKFKLISFTVEDWGKADGNDIYKAFIKSDDRIIHCEFYELHENIHCISLAELHSVVIKNKGHELEIGIFKDPIAGIAFIVLADKNTPIKEYNKINSKKV